jgi:two-component system CheB/CheR fusion protein
MENDYTSLNLVLEKLYRDRGYDFRDYKYGTITRRLSRRLHANEATTYPEYMQLLDSNPEEYTRLIDDLTISVSSFFRSPYTFQRVTEIVLPELIAYKSSLLKRGLRFWSAACAHGEEAYSVAILLTEFLKNRRQDFNIEIYATDIKRKSLMEAQAGRYPAKAVESLPRNTLNNFFTYCDNGSYLLKSNITQMVNFLYLDLTSTTTSPFMEMDCIFCCNVLIYWQKQLQERVLRMLYSTLATPGYLVLGEAETPTESMRDRLVCLDSQARIYKKVVQS